MSDLRKDAMIRSGLQTTQEYADPCEVPVSSTQDAVNAPQAATVAGSRVSTSENGPPYGIFPFPSPHQSAGYRTPPSPHHGPADSPTFDTPNTVMWRRRRDPDDPYFHEATYRLSLGNRHQPEARNPMSEPTDREMGTPGATPEQAEIRRLGAIRHMAMAFHRLQTGGNSELAAAHDQMYEQEHGGDYCSARENATFQPLLPGQTNMQAAIRHCAMAYRYLSSGDHDMADGYDTRFQDDFGGPYVDDLVDVIQNEPDNPPGSDEEEQGDDEYEYE